MLKMARIASVSIAIIGVLLVPVFQSFGSIYSAHGAFTAAITPPLVITSVTGRFLEAIFDQSCNHYHASWSINHFWSILQPEIITPFAHGVPMKEAKEGFLAGKDQYKFMRGILWDECLSDNRTESLATSFQISSMTLLKVWFGVPSKMLSATTKVLMELRT